MYEIKIQMVCEDALAARTHLLQIIEMMDDPSGELNINGYMTGSDNGNSIVEVDRINPSNGMRSR